jgi:hypothetical protein
MTPDDRYASGREGDASLIAEARRIGPAAEA